MIVKLFFSPRVCAQRVVVVVTPRVFHKTKIWQKNHNNNISLSTYSPSLPASLPTPNFRHFSVFSNQHRKFPISLSLVWFLIFFDRFLLSILPEWEERKKEKKKHENIVENITVVVTIEFTCVKAPAAEGGGGGRGGAWSACVGALLAPLAAPAAGGCVVFILRLLLFQFLISYVWLCLFVCFSLSVSFFSFFSFSLSLFLSLSLFSSSSIGSFPFRM